MPETKPETISRKLITGVLALALLASTVATQEPAKNETKPATSTAETPAKKLEAVVARYNKQQNDVYEAYGKTQDEKEQAKILAGLPGKEYIPEFRALAEEAKGTDTAVQAWVWVLRLTGDDNKEALRIVDLLLSDYIKSPALGALTGELRYASSRFGGERVIEALRTMASDSPNDPVRAGALFALANVLLESRKPADQTEARECLTALGGEFGKLSSGRGTYGEASERCLYELDHLQVGMVAPDFETTDENGATWKLSDYKGKVVVVDFWGFW